MKVKEMLLPLQTPETFILLQSIIEYRF